jgi:hypothetical protein
MGDDMKSSAKHVKIAVIFPSRGLAFSQTAEELLTALDGRLYKIFFSHRKPIPECFEEPTLEALKDPTITHLWYVEDDMILRPNTLTKLLEVDSNVVTADYPVTKDGKGSVFYDKGGNVVFCGTGCLLVKRQVFDSLKKPYFTDKVRWTMLNYGEQVKLTGVYGDTGYGTHDITFCIKLWNTGVVVKVIKQKLGQRKLVALGKAGSNNGAHQVETWRKIVKDARLDALLAQPVAVGAKSKLVTVDTPTGGITTTRKHAENLVAQGMASYPPRRYTIIDDSDVRI